MTQIRIYYGEMGSGKTYLAKQDAFMQGCPFLEGDQSIPPEMRALVRGFRPLARGVVDDYVANHLLPAIQRAARQGDVVVAQALYRREHRDRLSAELKMEGFQVRWLRPRCSFWRNLRQLWSRPRGFRWVCYWLACKPFFQP